MVGGALSGTLGHFMTARCARVVPTPRARILYTAPMLGLEYVYKLRTMLIRLFVENGARFACEPVH